MEQLAQAYPQKQPHVVQNKEKNVSDERTSMGSPCAYVVEDDEPRERALMSVIYNKL